MSAVELRRRWASADGRVLVGRVLEFLLGRRDTLPEGVVMHNGRWDLRGIVAPPAETVGHYVAGGVTAQVTEGVLEAHDVRWMSLDLTGSRLQSLRLYDSIIADCRFDGASCRDWRMWGSEVNDSSFVGSDLREATLGTWHEGRVNSWRGVDFARADLRGALGLGCLLERCSFVDTRLAGAQFLQATIRLSRFSGVMRDVLFDGRALPQRPDPGVFIDVDFRDVIFDDVDFRGCHFDGVSLPPGVHEIPDFPAVTRRVVKQLEHDDSVEARMLRAEAQLNLKLPGDESSVGVFDRAAYVSSGGELLAELAELVYLGRQ